mmetsp:Transcript_2444/g.5806  ORF Transcript_2444/g.5806 Transcript_2444/m.5806 type:complete len:90 (-) Transcript_2444:248-517(-)
MTRAAEPMITATKMAMTFQECSSSGSVSIETSEEDGVTSGEVLGSGVGNTTEEVGTRGAVDTVLEIVDVEESAALAGEAEAVVPARDVT